jgi:hypothetical protein
MVRSLSLPSTLSLSLPHSLLFSFDWVDIRLTIWHLIMFHSFSLFQNQLCDDELIQSLIVDYRLLCYDVVRVSQNIYTIYQ